MPPGSPSALEKTILAQIVHQQSSADLGVVARELNTHRLVEQRQGKPAVGWTERDVKLAYLQLFDAHVRLPTREALLDLQHLDDTTPDDFPFFAKGSEASHEIVTACFSEFYVGVDSNMRNLEADFEATLKELKKVENDESSSDEGEDSEDGSDATSAALVSEPVAASLWPSEKMDEEDSTSASEDDN